MTGLEALAKVIPQKDCITVWGVTQEEIQERLQKWYQMEIAPERLTMLLEYFLKHKLVTCKDGRYLQVRNGKL